MTKKVSEETEKVNQFQAAIEKNLTSRRATIEGYFSLYGKYLSANAKVVYQTLKHYDFNPVVEFINSEGERFNYRECKIPINPSIKSIVEISGLGRTMVIAGINELEIFGWLRVIRYKKSANISYDSKTGKKVKKFNAKNNGYIFTVPIEVVKVKDFCLDSIRIMVIAEEYNPQTIEKIIYSPIDKKTRKKVLKSLMDYLCRKPTNIKTEEELVKMTEEELSQYNIENQFKFSDLKQKFRINSSKTLEPTETIENKQVTVKS